MTKGTFCVVTRVFLDGSNCAYFFDAIKFYPNVGHRIRNDFFTANVSWAKDDGVSNIGRIIGRSGVVHLVVADNDVSCFACKLYAFMW